MPDRFSDLPAIERLPTTFSWLYCVWAVVPLICVMTAGRAKMFRALPTPMLSVPNERIPLDGALFVTIVRFDPAGIVTFELTVTLPVVVLPI